LALDRCESGGKGLDIVKSNWARPISTPPFYAYPIISGVCFAYGGVKTNSNGQVVDTDGPVLPGLYRRHVGDARRGLRQDRRRSCRPALRRRAVVPVSRPRRGSMKRSAKASALAWLRIKLRAHFGCAK
jgi:hypothetical protein